MNLSESPWPSYNEKSLIEIFDLKKASTIFSFPGLSVILEKIFGGKLLGIVQGL